MGKFNTQISYYKQIYNIMERAKSTQKTSVYIRCVKWQAKRNKMVVARIYARMSKFWVWRLWSRGMWSPVCKVKASRPRGYVKGSPRFAKMVVGTLGNVYETTVMKALISTRARKPSWVIAWCNFLLSTNFLQKTNHFMTLHTPKNEIRWHMPDCHFNK